jgi:hypothetical protein
VKNVEEELHGAKSEVTGLRMQVASYSRESKISKELTGVCGRIRRSGENSDV